MNKIIASLRKLLGRSIGKGKLWLVLGLALREYRQRYQGSLLGPFWPFLCTCAMVAIYGFVFSVVLKVKWQQVGVERGVSSGEPPFWLVLMAGQMLYALVAEILNKSPTLITAVPNYVKKIIFPLEILPIVSLLVALANAGITFGVLSLLAFIFVGISWHVLLTPLVFISLAVWCLGIGWFLGSIGVFFRDLQQVIPVFTQLLLFASPVFYPISAIPDFFHPYLNFNPLTSHITALRDLLLWHRLPDCWPLILSAMAGLLFAILGYYVFKKLRDSFADVL